MRINLLTAAVAAAVCGVSLPVHADFALGDETKGVTVKFNDEANMNVRVRLQPRIDFGDIGQNTTTGAFYTETDFSLRRVRLEVTGSVIKNLKYNLTLSADREDQNYRARRDSNISGGSSFTSTGGADDQRFGIQFAFLDYKFADAASLLFGQQKLPYSRISLASSSRQLIVERPFSSEDAKVVLGDYEQTHLKLHGKVADGIFTYGIALADGTDQNRAGTAQPTAEAGLAYIGRVEFSPPGWVEKGMSDAHLGKGRHLTFGLNAGNQDGIKSNGATTETSRKLMGADVSFHLGGFTAQAEYNTWTLSQTGLTDIEPKGWYVQAGYFIPGVNIEPAVRYEVYDVDTNAATDRENTYTTVGFNWYAKGHSVKVGVNWQKSEFGAGNISLAGQANERDVYQIQTQLYF